MTADALYDRFVAWLDDECLAEAAIAGLGALGDPRALDLLATRLESEMGKQRAIEAEIEALDTLDSYQKYQMLRARLRETNEALCRRIVAALGDLGDVRAVAPLLAYDRHVDGRNSGGAYHALWEIAQAVGAETMLPLIGVDELIDLIEGSNQHLEFGLYEQRQDRDWDRLARLGRDLVRAAVPPGDVATLAERLRREENPNLRRHIAKALGESKDPRAVDALLERLRSETDESAWRATVGALGALGDRRAVAPILAQIKATEDRAKLQVGIYALLDLLGSEADDVEIPLSLLDHPGMLQYASWWFNAVAKDGRGVAAVLARLEGEKDPAKVDFLCDLLRWLRDTPEITSAIEPLQRRIRQETDPQVQGKLHGGLVWVLRALPPEKVLARWQEETDPTVESCLLDALDLYENKSAIEPLLAALETADSDDRRGRIVNKLSDADDPRVAEALGKALADADLSPERAASRQRYYLAADLWRTRSLHAIEPLAAQVRREPTDLRHHIAYWLNDLTRELPADTLLTWLQSETHTDVRWAIARSLSRAGDAAALTPLLERLEQEEEPRTRWALAEAAGRIGRRLHASETPQPPSPSEVRATGAEGVGARGPAQRGNATGGGP